MLEEERRIATVLETDNQALVARIRALGFNGDSARVFDLLPLIHVSWADGTVQRGERATIFAILEQRSIPVESEASLLVESLLEERPPDAYMDATLALLKDLVGTMADEGIHVVDLCAKVADASGGLLGLGARVSPEERELIKKVADTLGASAHERFRNVLGG